MKIILLISILFLSNSALYSDSIPEDLLRPPIERKTHRRVKEVIRSAEVFDFQVRYGKRIEIGGRQFDIIEHVGYWVYKAKDLNTKRQVILKFQHKSEDRNKDAKVGKRSRYERDFFNKVPPHDNIVRGYSLEDVSGNILIVLPFIEGEMVDDYLWRLSMEHKRYFNDLFPELLEKFIGAVKGVEHIVRNGFYHEFQLYHILIDKRTRRFILFDFNLPPERVDLYTPHEIEISVIHMAGLSLTRLVMMGRRVEDDFDEFSIIPGDDVSVDGEIVNLKKIYPYIPDELNQILMRFAENSINSYTSIAELRSDLEDVLKHFKSEGVLGDRDIGKVSKRSKVLRSTI